MITGNFEDHARNLADVKRGTEARLRTATEIRDSIEIVHTSEYENFLRAFFPVFGNILQHGAPHFEDCPEQKLRNVLLEILNRLPHNEKLKGNVQELLKLSMHILNTDNEENSLICLRIIFDLHKNYRPTLDAYAQPFLDFVKKLYSNFKGMVRANFGVQFVHAGVAQARAKAQALAAAKAQAAAQAQAHAVAHAQAQAAAQTAQAAQAAAQSPAQVQAAAQAQAQAVAKAQAAAQAKLAAQAAAQIAVQAQAVAQAAAQAQVHASAQAQLESATTGSKPKAQSASPQGTEGEKSRPTVLVRSTDSFKVLIECPLIVMFLFQLYPKYIQSNIQVGRC